MSRLLWTGILLLAATSCASTILNPEERAALVEAPQHTWRPAKVSDIPGLYASEKLTGPMASALWKLYYNFDASGQYTGAALFAADPPRFEVLSGTWEFRAGRLSLDGGEAAETLADVDAIRLSGTDGTVVLRREREL